MGAAREHASSDVAGHGVVMRILVFNWKDIEHPAAGGAEVYTAEVARRLVAAGHAVTIFTSAVEGLPADDDAHGVRVIRRGSRLGVYRAARAFYRSEGRGNFDVVIDEVNTRPFGCASWVDDAPVVALIHQVCREIWFHQLPWPVAIVGRYALEPHWLRAYRSVPVLTVSRSSAESLRGYGLRHITIVPEGIENTARPPVAKEERPTVITVGRLVSSKRPDHVLQAFRLLRQALPQAQLWVVGDGPRARIFEGEPGVTCFGKVTVRERDELLARAHAMVVTSVREGWALVVDEAAAMGTPTIGYRSPGLTDSVPAAGGSLVDAAPAELAAHLTLNLPELVAQGRESSSLRGWRGGALSWDDVAERVLAALRRIAEPARVAEEVQ